MKISLVVLTYNRSDTVLRAMTHNKLRAGREIDELIWVDNGSTDHVHEVMQGFSPAVSVLNRENLGVAKGYNRGLALASGDYVVITGCDMLMPDDWLKTFEEYVTAIPETGVACMYSRPLVQVPERILGAPAEINGKSIIPALPIERRILRRDLLTRDIGFLREDFGLYGWEDVEWANRALRVCREKNLLTYVIPGKEPRHLGTEGIVAHDGKDPAEYHAMKAREAADPRKTALLNKCTNEGFPYYNPYA